MTIKAIAWDIDGTLVDSEPLHLSALVAVSENYQVDISDLPDDHFVGVSLINVWAQLKKRYPSNLSLSKWMSELNRYYFEHAHLLKIMPGAVEVIKVLARQQVVQVAVSNSSREIVNTNLAALGVSDIFEFSLSLEDVSLGKPNPAPYLKALERLGLDADQVIAVEDSPSGIESAREAGLAVLVYSCSSLDTSGAHMKIRQLSEVYQFFQE